MSEGSLAVVVMAGGAGTRFWPASTKSTPKQLLRFFGARSLLQQSVDRALGLVPPSRCLVVTSADFVDGVRAQLPELPADNIVAEPSRRDTAAAVALAALLVEHRVGRDAVMAVLTADQLIEPVDAFHRTLRSAVRGAQRAPSALYTFGIEPTFAATGYGYLEQGDALTDADVDDGGVAHARVARFVEKPDAQRAAQYLAGGRHLWNAGMFVWRTGAILDEFERSLPAHVTTLRPIVAAGLAGLADAFASLQKISVDFAIMEKARDVRCVRARFAWSDVGSFTSLADHLPHDAQHNVARGRLRTHDASSNIVFCEDDRELVALIGVHDLVVVRAGARTLVVPRARAEEIKTIVAQLEPGDV